MYYIKNTYIDPKFLYMNSNLHFKITEVKYNVIPTCITI